MASLKKAANCIGLSGPLSILRDFYGYRTGAPKQLSLLTQVRLLQGSHIHLNLIRTAFLNDTFLQQLDAALQLMRDNYASVNLGIGRIKRFQPVHGGYEIIVDESVALDLFDSWSAPGDAIDVFLTLMIVGSSIGLSPVHGSCDKDGKDSGVLIGVFDSGSDLWTSLAHETGHYLGLEHDGSITNLMAKTAPNGGYLSPGQGATMKMHCFIRAGCAI